MCVCVCSACLVISCKFSEAIIVASYFQNISKVFNILFPSGIISPLFFLFSFVYFGHSFFFFRFTFFFYFFYFRLKNHFFFLTPFHFFFIFLHSSRYPLPYIHMLKFYSVSSFFFFF